MRSFWKKANDKQLDLLGVDSVVPDVRRMDTPALVKTGSLRAYEPRRIARGDPSGTTTVPLRTAPEPDRGR